MHVFALKLTYFCFAVGLGGRSPSVFLAVPCRLSGSSMVSILQCVTVMKAMGHEQIVSYKEESG